MDFVRFRDNLIQYLVEMEKRFEFASRNKLRFNYRGLITVEDLWDLSCRELDKIYKGLMSEKKETETESLIEKQTENTILETKIELVKYVFNTKVEEAEAMTKKAENAAKKQKILAILARKQDAELENKSAEELEALIKDL